MGAKMQLRSRNATDYKCPPRCGFAAPGGPFAIGFEDAQPPEPPFPDNAQPPDGVPTGLVQAHVAGRPATRCQSKRKELARDVPARDFVERKRDADPHDRETDQLRPLHLRHVPVAVLTLQRL